MSTNHSEKTEIIPSKEPNKKILKPDLPNEPIANPPRDPSKADEPEEPNKLYEEQLPPENELT
jgi:hypothetical protein